MSTAQEMAKMLNGNEDNRKQLYQELLDKIASGENLIDHEIIFMEALKNIYTKNISAKAFGNGEL